MALSFCGYFAAVCACKALSQRPFEGVSKWL
jgi:hypothetical protein